MRVSSAFLANHAEVHDGLVFVAGGFPEWCNVTHVPGEARFTLVVVLEVDRHDVDRSHHFEIELWQGVTRGPIAAPHVDITRSNVFVAGAPMFHAFVVPLAVEVHEVGPGEILVKYDGDTIGAVQFGVRIV